MNAWQQALETVSLLGDVPVSFWSVLWVLLLIGFSTYPLLLMVPLLRLQVQTTLERCLFALLLGIAVYTLVFCILNAVFQLPISALSFYMLAAILTLSGYGRCYLRGGMWHSSKASGQGLIALGLMALLVVAGATRLPGTLKAPDRLLDSDPYRHYPRVEWIVQTGNIARSDPWLAGQVPVFELQGCYVLAALLATATGVDAWTVWKYGSILMGVLSILSFYLLAAYFLRGPPRRLGGLLAAMTLAAITVHITRTNIGFSVAWALPFLPVALLAFLWTFRCNSFQAGLLFALLFLAVGLSNMVPVSIVVAVLAPYSLYQAIKRARQLWSDRQRDAEAWLKLIYRPFGGLLLGTALFLGYLLLWQETYASASLQSIARGSAFENREIMKRVYEREEAGARSAAQGDRTLSPLHRALGHAVGWHNTVVLDRYIDHDKLVLGVLALALLLVAPGREGRSRFRGLQAIGGFPQGPAVDEKVFLALFLLVPLLQFSLLPSLMRASTIEPQEVLDTQAVLQHLASGDPVYQRVMDALVAGHAPFHPDAGETAGPVAPELARHTLGLLNRAIADNRFFGNAEHPFDLNDVPLRGSTRALVRQTRRGDDLEYINRRIVEDLFPGGIKRRDLLGFIRVPTYTGRSYRYLLFTAFCLSLSTGLALALLLEFTRRFFAPSRSTAIPWVPALATAGIYLLLMWQAVQARAYGSWPPSTRPNEEQALRWLTGTLPEESVIFAYWFQADFIRSYAARSGKPMSVVFTGSARRSGVRSLHWPPIELQNLDVPDIRSIAEMLDYSAQQTGNYYVFKGRHGPGLPLMRDTEHFTMLARFPGDQWGDVEIFQLDSNPAQLQPVRHANPKE